MRQRDIRSCFQPPGPSLGAALLALFFAVTRSTAARRHREAGGGSSRRFREGLPQAPYAWPRARQIWQH